MMKVEIKVPSMGESVTEATIAAILVEDGAFVAMDAEVMELETDKVNQVLYAPQAGVFRSSVQIDDTVVIGAVVGVVDPSGAPTAAAPAASAPVTAPAPVAAPAPAPVAAYAPAAVAPSPGPAPGEQTRFSKAQFAAEFSTPAAPATPAASSPAPRAPVTSPAPPSAPRSGTRGESRKKMSKIRKMIAKRLVEAQHSTAMLTTFNEVDLTEVMALRKKYKEHFVKKYGTKLGFMSFFVKAVVSALQAVPEVNASIEGEELVTREYYDIGIAVGTPRGLIVPVLRDCELLSFSDIELGIMDFANKARTGGLNVDDLQGGCFTITNGGTYGSLLSTPILNPPQSGILGMHKIQKRPVVIDDQIVVRPMMYLAMSYDHRVVDGKEAVTFLVHIKEALEDPSRLLLEL